MRRFLGYFAPLAAITATAVSVHAEPAFTRDPVGKMGGPVAIGTSLELFTYLRANPGGFVGQAFNAYLNVLAPVKDRWNLYFGPGVGLFHVTMRAGVNVIPLGRRKFGPELTLGARGELGAIFMSAPDFDLPPGAFPGQQNIPWSYRALFLEGALGLRFPTNEGASDIVISPTILWGPVRYSTRGQTNGGPVETFAGISDYVGGTLAVALSW